MTVLGKYVVICDCTPGERIIAWIDDDRATGGRVRIDSDVIWPDASAPHPSEVTITYSFGCRNLSPSR